jgi:hypothetical protein
VKLLQWGVEDYLITREESEELNNENFHVHVYMKLKVKCLIRRENFLDINEIHGNYQPVKKRNDVLAYLLKNIGDKNNSENIICSKNINRLINETCELITEEEFFIKQAEEGKIPETLEYLKLTNPKRFFKEGKIIEQRMREIRLMTMGFKTKFNMEQFIVPENLKEGIFKEEIYRGEKSIFLIGAPGSGKTQFIRTFISNLNIISGNNKNLKYNGNPCEINNMDGLRFFNKDIHDSILIDDLNWAEIKDRETLIKLLDSEDQATINIKHSSILIPSNTPRYIVSNKSLEEYLTKRKDIEICGAIRRRFIEIKLEKDIKLFCSKKVVEEKKEQ